MKASVLAFVGVGIAAALVHYLAALGAHALGFTPAWSNNVGFILAFPVSYLGHRQWSFRQSEASHQQALLKFFCVALLGFFGNQGLLWCGLQFTPWPFWLVLGLVMGVVAASTYLLSRFWAFKHG